MVDSSSWRASLIRMSILHHEVRHYLLGKRESRGLEVVPAQGHTAKQVGLGPVPCDKAHIPHSSLRYLSKVNRVLSAYGTFPCLTEAHP